MTVEDTTAYECNNCQEIFWVQGNVSKLACPGCNSTAIRLLIRPRPDSANPKHSQGMQKLPLHLWPQTATALGSLGMLEGASKYGRNNFRATPVYASIYYAALLRHTAAWFNGEDADPQTGVPHLGNALSCLAILVDAGANGTLVDDRNYNGKEKNYADLVKELTPLVDKVQQLFADRNPTHYTIESK